MQNQKSLHALLIGINGYQAVAPLAGCLNDVLAVSDYFQNLCANQEPPIRWAPTYLLAPATQDEEARLREKGITWGTPTRQNIIDQFAAFDPADPVRGDYCLFYYSGHGSYMRAPEAFLECSPSGSLQTIVCADSRVHDTPDLLDKELGYLIAKALEGKAPLHDGNGQRPGVHFIAITDSCHSGTNTRGDERELTARMTPPGPQTLPEDNILGFTRTGNCFYQPFEPGQTSVKRYGGLKHPRYIKFSACQDAEKAFETLLSVSRPGSLPETLRQGIFTHSMLAALNQCGAKIGYGELMSRIQIEVGSRVNGQVPLLDNTLAQDDDLFFLRNEFSTPKQEYEVWYHAQTQEWRLNAGAIHGMVPSSEHQKTLVRIIGSTIERIAEVREVRAGESVLDAATFSDTDRANRLLRASISKMAFPHTLIGFGPTLTEPNTTAEKLRAAVYTAWELHPPTYLAWANEGQRSDLEINLTIDRDGTPAYILTRPGSRVSLFVRQANAATFLVNAEKAARFENVLRMGNAATQIPRQAFRVDVQVMEGMPFHSNNIDQIFNEATLLPENYRRYTDPDNVEVRYVPVNGKPQQPALKIAIAVNGIPEDSYWVGALYCDAQLGITAHYLPVQRLGQQGAPFANLEFRSKATDIQKWEAIPVMMHSGWRDLGVIEITDYVILFISNTERPFNLRQYEQQALELDQTRSTGFGPETNIAQTDWFTIKIPITIRRPETEKPVAANSTAVFPGFKLKMPTTLAATVQATNTASVKHRIEQLQRAKSALDFRTLLPPGTLWTGLEGAEETFSRSPVAQPDQLLNILEITDAVGTISEQQPIKLFPDDPLSTDETILPFAYDEAAELYYPVGYTDEHGVVCITEMPRPTSGVIGPDGVAASKDVAGSVKLFFRKIVWSKLSGIHDYRTLVLFQKNGDTLERLEYRGRDREAAVLGRIRMTLNGQTDVLLLVHGFVGDAEDMVEAVFHRTDLHERYGAVLAFQYENLGTSNRDTAKALHDMLVRCQVPPKSITVVAHSMGGLVSRWWIERTGGNALVRKLIQVGTPNGGSEMADLRKKLVNLLTLGLNGWPPLLPYKPFLAFVGRGINGSLFKTLQELQPNSSFLTELNDPAVPVPDVAYQLLEGDTTTIEANFDEDDPMWKKLWACLRDRSRYIAADYLFFDNEPNDMVVKTASMRHLPRPHIQVVPVSCDHLRYFNSSRGLDALREILR